MKTENVHLTVDAVVFRGADDQREVLLIKRGWSPFLGHWALPGGYVENDERCPEAAVREGHEETGILCSGAPELIGVYDDPKRDPRGRVVSIAYLMTGPCGPMAPVAGDDAAEAVWVKLKDVRIDTLAFDHAHILEDALLMLKGGGLQW